MARGQVDPNDLTIGDEAEAVITHAPSNERLDTYVLIEADGEYGEHHIWASETESERLKEFLIQQLREWGYDDEEFRVTVDVGGEYDWVVNDTVDLKELAEEILDNDGFVDQKEG